MTHVPVYLQIARLELHSLTTQDDSILLFGEFPLTEEHRSPTIIWSRSLVTPPICVQLNKIYLNNNDNGRLFDLQWRNVKVT